MSAEVKFCKEFLQQISKLSVEYPEGYIERRRGPIARPAVSKTAAAPAPKTSGAGFKVVLKKLGGVGKAYEVVLSANSTVSELKIEASKLFSADNFTMMYKGRSLSDDASKVSSLVDDPSTAVYVSIKSGSAAKPSPAVAVASAESLSEEFWNDFGKLLGKHASQPAAAKLQSRFRQEYSKWL